MVNLLRTIQLGLHEDASDLRRDMAETGCKIGGYADYILNHPSFTVSDSPTEIDLLVVTMLELNFSNGADWDEILKRVKELDPDLELCPPEAGPELILHMSRQPEEYKFELIIAMKPFMDWSGGLNIFGVGHDKVGLWLRGYHGNPFSRWGSGSRWVFARRNKN